MRAPPDIPKKRRSRRESYFRAAQDSVVQRRVYLSVPSVAPLGEFRELPVEVDRLAAVVVCDLNGLARLAMLCLEHIDIRSLNPVVQRESLDVQPLDTQSGGLVDHRVVWERGCRIDDHERDDRVLKARSSALYPHLFDP